MPIQVIELKSNFHQTSGIPSSAGYEHVEDFSGVLAVEFEGSKI